MRLLAGLAACAAVLAVAAPALAGGYWDAQPPQPAAATAPCDRACPPPPCGCWRDRYAPIRRAAPPPSPPGVVLPSEFFETEGSVGPPFADYGYAGGEAVEFAGANASAFASASASARVSVSVRVAQHVAPRPAPHGCGCGHR